MRLAGMNFGCISSWVFTVAGPFDGRVPPTGFSLIAPNRTLYRKTSTKYDSAMRILDADIEVEPDRGEQRRDQPFLGEQGANLW